MSNPLPLLLRLLAVVIVPVVGAQSLSLGVVFKGEPASGVISVTNPRSSTLVVAGVEASCDCLQLVSSPREILPGAAVQIPFTYRSAATGRFAVDVVLRAADSGPVPPATRVEGFVADRAWQISPREALAALAAADTTFVDTHRPDLFAQLHLPRSVNLAAFALKVREDLKPRRVVLVDEGYSADLLEQARQLRGRGFDRVMVLTGGLPAWLRAGGTTEGPDVSRLSASTVSPADVARTWNECEWSLVSVGGPSARLPDGPAMLRIERWEELAPLIPRLTEALPGRTAPRVLVLAASEATYARIEQLVGPQAAGSLYFLKGGVAAWENHLAVQAALAGGPRQVTQVRKGGGLPPSTGCSACGAK